MLISLLNHIDEARCFQTDEASVGQIMSTFVENALGHFRREEKLMEKSRYPKLSEHMKMHRSIERQLKILLAKHERALDSAVSGKITNLLYLWLDDHLLNADMQYKGILGQPTNGPGRDGSA